MQVVITVDGLNESDRKSGLLAQLKQKHCAVVVVVVLWVVAVAAVGVFASGSEIGYNNVDYEEE